MSQGELLARLMRQRQYSWANLYNSQESLKMENFRLTDREEDKLPDNVKLLYRDVKLYI